MRVSEQVSRKKEIMFGAITVVITCVVCLALAEIFLRFKNSSMENYDIEMWRYSAELKQASPDPDLGHVHQPSKEAVLQQVSIRIDENGLRGASAADIADYERRVMFLGSSITLGWGVAEEETVTARLEDKLRMDGQDVRVLNAGIGNYNATRYVKRFLEHLSHLEPTDIVVHYFLRDAEVLEPGGGNFLLRNSQLAVTVWIAINRLQFGGSGENTLVDHYESVYSAGSPGLEAMEGALKQLADYADKNGIRLHLAMVPDVHNLADYKFDFVHDHMRELSQELGYQYVDLKPAFGTLAPEEVWAMPGDPHPNALGHGLMAEAIYPLFAEFD